ncbi:hypothetical protein FA13DRAFT_345108 [Coprinellus micaceus]|uniref:Uncharacterized protein n=1 Tax=Coprinellus micaceus TaxID=71717 RepID=A0A4Y7SCV9_COPMI|nr:hypothetical protein FA13DRAFT_345108 [Coprinellus micaceus]
MAANNKEGHGRGGSVYVLVACDVNNPAPNPGSLGLGVHHVAGSERVPAGLSGCAAQGRRPFRGWMNAEMKYECECCLGFDEGLLSTSRQVETRGRLRALRTPCSTPAPQSTATRIDSVRPTFPSFPALRRLRDPVDRCRTVPSLHRAEGGRTPIGASR